MHRFLLAATLAIISETPAVAHTGMGNGEGLLRGFAHPVGGLDHILAIVAVGLFAALLGGRALWAVPGSFIAMMVVGCLLGASGLTVPFPELGILLSVIVLGFVIAIRISMPLAASMALVGFFAVFHGYAHGAEMPDTSSGLAYGAGFIIATALLHAAGIGLGLTARTLGGTLNPRAMQALGALIAITGIGLLTLSI